MPPMYRTYRGETMGLPNDLKDFEAEPREPFLGLTVEQRRDLFAFLVGAAFALAVVL